MRRFGLYKLFHICWFVFLAVIFAVMCLKTGNSALFLAFGLLGLAAAVGVSLWLRRKEISDRAWAVCLGAGVLFMYALMLFFIKAMYIEPFSDSGVVWYSVADIVESGSVSQSIDRYARIASFSGISNHDYFLAFPNTRFNLAFLVPLGLLLDRVFGVNLRSPDAYFLLSAISAMLIAASVILCAVAVKKARSKAASLLFLLLCAAFLPFYLNAYRLHTETLTMPFISLALLLVAEAEHSEKNAFILYFTAGLSTALGMLLKGSVTVLFVALVIFILVCVGALRRKTFKLLCLLLGVLPLVILWSVLSYKLPWLDYSRAERYELPKMHWIMMASHGDGAYVQSDVDYSLSYETKEERENAALERFRERVKGYGLGGYVKFLLDKTTHTFFDGLFFQENYLEQFSQHKFGVFISPGGQYFKYTAFYASAYLCMLYMAMLCSAIINAIRGKGIDILLHMCVLGLILFLSLWESKSRYLLNFTPVFIMICALAADDIVMRLQRGMAIEK